MAKKAQKIVEYIDPATFEKFKAYTKRMLTDIFNAKVTPYCNNDKMQEITLAWDADPKAKFGDYPPENMTHIVKKPYKNPLDIGDYVFKETVNILMRQAGFKDNTAFTVSGARKGQFGVNMVTGYDGDSSILHMFHLRANGNLAKAQDYLRNLDDAALDKACRDSLASFRRGVGPAPG